MKNLLKLIGITAIGAVIGFGFAGCDNGTTSNSGGGLDKALVAKWHSTQAAADSGTSVVFEITANGRMTGQAFTTEVKVTTSGGRISATTEVNGQTVDGGSADYVVEGTTLKFSNPSAGAGYFTSLIAGQDLSSNMGGDGKYHKSAGSGSGNNDNGIDAPKTIVIQDMSSSIYEGLLDRSSGIFVCEVGTSIYDASTQGKYVARALMEDASGVISGGGARTVTLPLFNPGSTTRWTGHGTFDIVWPSGDYFTGYRASSVTISSEITTLKSSSFSVPGYSPIPGLGASQQ
jgi:hypothetical protein